MSMQTSNRNTSTGNKEIIEWNYFCLTLLQRRGSLANAVLQISNKSFWTDVLKAVNEALANTLDSNSDNRPAPVAWNVPLETTNGTDDPLRTLVEGGTWINVSFDGMWSIMVFSLVKVYWSSDRGVYERSTRNWLTKHLSHRLWFFKRSSISQRWVYLIDNGNSSPSETSLNQKINV